MDEAVCWATGIPPSKLPKFYWAHTRFDIRIILKVKMGEAQAQAFQNYETLALILSQALGGETSGKEDARDSAKDANEAVAQLGAMLKLG